VLRSRTETTFSRPRGDDLDMRRRHPDLSVWWRRCFGNVDRSARGSHAPIRISPDVFTLIGFYPVLQDPCVLFRFYGLRRHLRNAISPGQSKRANKLHATIDP